jgi:hypothetical protein
MTSKREFARPALHIILMVFTLRTPVDRDGIRITNDFRRRSVSVSILERAAFSALNCFLLG